MNRTRTPLLALAASATLALAASSGCRLLVGGQAVGNTATVNG